MNNEFTSLFPEKDIISIIDLKFLDYLKTEKLEDLITGDQLKVAVSEYSVIADKIKHLKNLEEKIIEDIREKADRFYGLFSEKQGNIRNKVEKYFESNWDKISWASGDAEKSQAVIEFEHGKIIIESTQKINFKIISKHF